MRSFRSCLCLVSLLGAVGCHDKLVLTPVLTDAGQTRTRASKARAANEVETLVAEQTDHASAHEGEEARADGDAGSLDRRESRESVSSVLADDGSERGDSAENDRLAIRFGAASDPACDLNGYWVAKQTLINQAELAGEQRTAQWYYLVLAQEGSEVTMLDHHDCGQLTRGSAEVVVPRETLKVLVTKNSWKGRKAQVERVGDHCEIEFERAWTVRGADPHKHLPAGVFAAGGLSAQHGVALPSKDAPSGAENWNGSGLARLGFAMSVSGAANGTRFMTQRLYNDWFTSSEYKVRASERLDTIVLGASFDSEMAVLSVDPPNPLLQNLLPRPDGEHPGNNTVLKLLGRGPDEPTVAEVVGQSDLVKRCLKIQNELLPY